MARAHGTRSTNRSNSTKRVKRIPWPSLPKTLLKHLGKGVPMAEASFEKSSGRFLAANGGWAVTNQDVIYPLAMLATTPGSEYEGDKRLLELIARGGDALRHWQAPDGAFEFIKADGSRWGKIYMPWSIYHWLEAYRLIADDLTPGRRKRWEQGLTLAFDGLAAQHRTPHMHNIPTWNGMSLTRAGLLFERDDWYEVGQKQIYHSTDHQDPDGYWPEGFGPTNGYNRVYTHAIGLYHHFTGDRHVLPALRRATRFHATFTYPDAVGVETIDGRQRYEGNVPNVGWPGLALTPQGRRLIELEAGHLSAPETGAGRELAHIAAGYATAFNQSDAEVEPLGHEQPRYRHVFRRKALVRRHNEWFYCVSGYTTPPEKRHETNRNRWIANRSNLLSIWHESLGLIVGGGNAKFDPAFATFEVWADGACRTEPDRCTFSQQNGQDIIRMHVGPHTCLLKLKPTGQRMSITYELPARTARDAQVTASLTLLPRQGSTVRFKDTGSEPREETIDPQRRFELRRFPDVGRQHATLVGEGWQLTLPRNTTFTYPVYPLTPYKINWGAGPRLAVGGVGIGFDDARSKTLVLSVT